MSDQKSSPDWLPAGWTTEVKVRKNGKVDKCYSDSSNGRKFYSKPEVLRYLNDVEVSPSKSEEKNTGTTEINFVVEEAVAEGLPPGWIKETRVRKKGRMIRKDPYYTDPASGYVFRSLKDAHRYLKTGELGRLASKPKDKGRIDVELGDDKFSSHAVAEGQNLADGGSNRQIIGNQSSELVEAVKDKQILDSGCISDSPCHSEYTSDQCREGAAASGVNLPEAKCLEQREGKSESTVHMSVSAPKSGAFPEKLSLENGVEMHGNIKPRINKSKYKREPDMPRRSSKRLAGIELDLAPEPKMNDRTRRFAARQSREAATSAAENSSDLATPEGRAGTESAANAKQELPVVLLPASLPNPQEHAEQVGTENKADVGLLIPPEHAVQVETDNKAEVKPGSPVNLSNLWTDPCIEFAIKTLTGAIPIEEENKADENPGSPLDLSFGDLWTDPCIEFAVKTLTGAIPVGDDLCVQDYFQQHVSSSEAQADNGSTGLSSWHFDTTEKSPYKQQDLVEPMLPCPGNVSLQNSGDTGRHQHVGGTSGECSRQTVV